MHEIVATVGGSPPMRLAISGAAGRMGQALVRSLARTSGTILVGAFEAEGSPALGIDSGILAGSGSNGVPVSVLSPNTLSQVDGIIDFSTPRNSVENLAWAEAHGLVLVLGTTGFSEDEQRRFEATPLRARMVRSESMSLGINLISQAIKMIAAATGPDFDIEVVETHHRHKRDAPSGTARLLALAAVSGRGDRLEFRGAARTPDRAGTIGIASLRGGGVKGDHTVIFASDYERIEITHRADDREAYASGAVAAALWAKGMPAGAYSMADVLERRS